MIWLVGILGVVIGFVLGIIASRQLIEDQRKKALEMATLLINSKTDEPKVVHPSVSLGCAQQFEYVMICGGTDGAEA